MEPSQELIIGTITVIGGIVLFFREHFKFGNNKVNNKAHSKARCSEVTAHNVTLDQLTEITKKHYGKIETMEDVSRQQHILITSLNDRVANDRQHFEDRFKRGQSVLNEIPNMKTNIRLIAAKVGVPKEELE